MSTQDFARPLSIALIVIFTFYSIAEAAIYKCVEANGKVTFSGFPCGNNAELIELDSNIRKQVQNNKPQPALPENTQNGTALISLLNQKTKIRLTTKTMYCFRGLTTWQGPYLVLPSGLKIPFKGIRIITNTLSADKSTVSMSVITFEGESTSEDFTKPWLKIAGDNALGRFAKQVNEISSIVFSR
ncbi:MAG: DUF4124 domain-containing protein [Gammaproteobacteria bacterium]|nr:DUF4124 domain-containing protein [Gammaproteobacteria bacterium]